MYLCNLFNYKYNIVIRTTNRPKDEKYGFSLQKYWENILMDIIFQKWIKLEVA